MKKYFDIDGKEISIKRLCRAEPDWASNAIIELQKRNEELDKTLLGTIHARNELRGKVVCLRTALEEMRDHHGENGYTELCKIADEALKGEK